MARSRGRNRGSIREDIIIMSENGKIVCTVGELKKALEGLNSDMQLDLYACCYDRNNYVCIRRDRYSVNYNEPLRIYMYIDNGKLKFENERTEDMELSD